MTIEERFLSRVDKSVDRGGCWPWLGGDNGEGYGRFWIGKQAHYAHRFSYELVNGPIPAGMTIDHLCRNRRCVNPYHLEAVSNRENILRGEGAAAVAARRTHCPKGHPYEAANTILADGGRHRRCRICTYSNARRTYRARVAAGGKW